MLLRGKSSTELREEHGDRLEGKHFTYRWCEHCEEYHIGEHGPTPFTGPENICPLCGEEYDSYLTHITQACEGRD